MNLTPREQADVEAALGLAVDPVAPSPELKASLMAKIALTPQLPPVEPDAELVTSAPSVSPIQGLAQQGQAQEGQAQEGRAQQGMADEGRAEQRAQARWFSRPVTILVAAAAAVLLFVGGTFVGGQFIGNNAPNIEAQSLATLTAAGDLQRASADIAGGGEATLIWSLDQRKSAILVNDLPPLSAGKTYQLWYIGGEGPIPAGTFESSTSATTWRVLDGQMSGGDTVGVTVEPSGGSAKPTTDPIVAIASS